MLEHFLIILVSGALLASGITACSEARTQPKIPPSAPSGVVEETAAPVFDLENGTVLLTCGYEMPIAGLGTYALLDEGCYNSVTTLLEAGGRLIDTASFYGNENGGGAGER